MHTIHQNAKRLGAVVAFVLLMAGGAHAQSTMTDNQVLEYAQSELSKGRDQKEVFKELVQRGVTTDQLQRVRQKYQSMKEEEDNNKNASGADNRMRKSNGQKRRDYSSQMRGGLQSVNENNAFDFLYGDTVVAPVKNITKKRIFGHDYFNNPNLTFESSMNIATPQNYTLGPGDVVIIDISGASQQTIRQTISPDGNITVNDYGTINLGGLSVTNAKNRIRSLLGERYQSSRIDMSLGQTRTITVSVVGEVKMPGTYTLSAFATVYNVLYMAGGPNQIGTLRSVKVYRGGKLLSNVDVYDFVLNGKLTGDVRLQDNDIVTVGPYESLVNVTGKVKRPMYYEMKQGESLATAIKYAGGFTGDSYQKAVRVNRKDGQGYSVFNVGEFDINSFKLMDEDSITVDSTLNRYQNMARITGAVFRPGMYQIGGNITTVKTLVEAAAGLSEGAIANHAVMHRMKADRSLQVVSLDLEGILEGTLPDIPLKNEDAIHVASNRALERDKIVTIRGEVVNPGIYDYADNETLEDLVLQAGGLTDAASVVRVDVSRRVTNPKATETSEATAETFSFSLQDGFVIKGEPGFTLKPYDQVVVRRSPSFNNIQTVRLEGEVLYEGAFTLTKKGQRLSEIIKQAGGLTDQAFVRGARLLRRMTAEEQEQAVSMIRAANRNSGKDSIDTRKLLVSDNYPVGIELDKALAHPGSDYDPVLRHGDRIIVPQYSNTVTVNGEVLYPNTLTFKQGKSAKYYIKQAGGYSSTGKKNKTFIVYANGTVAKADASHKPEPGCQIVVPTKNSKKGLTLPEILAIGTSTASLATMIATIANLIK